MCGAAGRAVCGRLCLRAGTSDRCAPAVLSLPPLRGGPLTVHDATGGYAVRSPCPSGIPRPRHKAPALGLEGLPCFDLLAASIRKSGLEIENRCMDCPCFGLLAASIRKSRPKIKNRCTDCPCFGLLAASIRKSGLEIENRCSAIVPASRTARLRKDVAATMTHPILIFFAANRTVPPTEGRCRIVERPACSKVVGAQAGTGCHEGGIIRSKKPPEWRLPLPQQRSASDSNLRRRKVERSASDSNLRCGKEDRKDIHKMMQLIYGRILNLATGDFWKI